ncbi:hypothetical protein LINGRAHAP2_LOCUS27987 [Linum grandiflorum]
MGCNLLGLWVFDRYGSSLIRWLPLQFLLRILSWTINMRLSSYSLRSFAAVIGKSIFLLFTPKQIMQQTIWPILAIISLMRCIFLILQIRVCPTGFITILWAFLCPVL